MKLAVLSDIHGNYIALEACYNYINLQEIDGIIYLGDYVCDCPYPQRTLKLIEAKSKEYQSWFIRGNREEYLLNHHENPDDGWKYSSSSGSLLYTYENLTNANIEFFQKCESATQIELPDYLPLTICHGSPLSTREQLHRGSDMTNNYLKTLETGYLLCGHTHNQVTYSAYGKTMINPGSVGIQTNHQTHSQFAILHWNHHEWIPEFVSVEYNIEQILGEFEPSGLNEKAKIWARAVCKALQTGKDYPRMCLELAWQYASEKENLCNPVDIAEEYWQEAGKRLNIL